MVNDRYNLVDELWIPVINNNKVSLRNIFTNSNLKGLSGNPLQKVAILKLLLAIVQSAYTPKDSDDWNDLRPSGMAKKCLDYLDKWYDKFYLYGNEPFLQFKNVDKAEIKSFSTFLPEISTGNTTILTQIQQEKILDDSDKAMLLVSLLGFAFGGKKVDNSISLTPEYIKKPTGKSGTSLGFKGFLHNFISADTMQETLWLNTFTQENIESLKIYSGLGVAPWEIMPRGEADEIAKALTKSLMGRLIPMCRFMVLTENGIHITEGISHLDYNDGMYDPSIAVLDDKNKIKVMWADPQKSTWRSICSLLSFLKAKNNEKDFECEQLKCCLNRVMENQELNKVAIWSGGVSVNSNAGEQYISGNNDYVEWDIKLDNSYLGETWFNKLELEIIELDKISGILYKCIIEYYKKLSVECPEKAKNAQHCFWQKCELVYDKFFIEISEESNSNSNIFKWRKIFCNFILETYDFYCEHNTARQLEAWIMSRPNLSIYLKKVN